MACCNQLGQNQNQMELLVDSQCLTESLTQPCSGSPVRRRARDRIAMADAAHNATHIWVAAAPVNVESEITYTGHDHHHDNAPF